MAKEYKTPGVYIEEIPKLPPSIASVETAIPAFIGYTAKAKYKEDGDLKKKPWRITSLLEYEQFFGKADLEGAAIEIIFDDSSGRLDVQGKVTEATRSKYLMYYSMQLFFDNGGGPCWIVSMGDYSKGVILDTDLIEGLNEVEKINEVTLLLFPDAMNMTDGATYYTLHKAAIDQAVKLQDRFVVMDVFRTPITPGLENIFLPDIELLRNNVSGDTTVLKYGAAYFPRIYTTLNFQVDETKVKITNRSALTLGPTLAATKSANNAAYFMAINALNNTQMLMPVSSAVVGVYAFVDDARGVWKAPANINIDDAVRPELLITNSQQEKLNVDDLAGKSINVIRSFEGRGPAIIWGARTLAGNDNEWRYIPVRRYFNMVEESTKNATEQFVFEPNDRNTWIRVKSMIENYLTNQWKAGALMGTTTREAYFVKVGLNETMSEQDIFEGRMIVQIGLAVVRPAEFIILEFMHKMLSES